MKEAERQNFEFAVSEDAGALSEYQKQGCDVTGQLIVDLRFAAEHFETSPAYIRFESRPAVFFFGLEKFPIDWRRVRESLPQKSLFFFRNRQNAWSPDGESILFPRIDKTGVTLISCRERHDRSGNWSGGHCEWGTMDSLGRLNLAQPPFCAWPRAPSIIS